MKVSIGSGSLARDRSGLLAVLFRPDDLAGDWLPRALRDAVRVPIKVGDFEAKKGQTAVVYESGRRVLLVGLGKDPDADCRRRAAAAASRVACKNKVKTVAVALPGLGAGEVGDSGRALAEGLVLGAYWFHGQRTSKPERTGLTRASVFAGRRSKALEAALRSGTMMAEAQCTARDLGNSPGNVATPSYLARLAQKIARQGKLRCKVVRAAELKRRKFGGLLGVNRGSDEPPVFIELEYRPARYQKTVCLVGKGLTFDTGGISLKPPAGMEEMKFDMCGGAAVLGAMQAVSKLRPKGVRVVGLVPSTDNMPGGSALKPGDVITSYGGISIEVINTDAEGRLILADALGRAQEFKPDYTIDLATLTGACVVALGHRATGLFSASEDLTTRLREAGEATHERLWPLPHWDEYQDDMKSTVADIKNSGTRWGGAITAYAFLKKFAGDMTWAHLDVAGTAWDMPRSAYYEGGATGVGVRLLCRFLEDL